MIKNIKRNVWSQSGNDYYANSVATNVDKLPLGVYTIKRCPVRLILYLEKIQNKFEFLYKIYGIEQRFINRVVKTYEKTSSNLGVLLNGTKGTGKTITCELICNALNLPVIVVRQDERDLTQFLSNLNENVIIYFDEFEKIFDNGNNDDEDNSKNGNKLLSIMDGVFNNPESRKVFLLTTNRLHIDPNFIQRPGRIRYLKTFGNLEPKVIGEILDDQLINKEFRTELIKQISTLDLITVDIITAIINEVNIHGDLLEDFISFFNVEKMEKKFNVYIQVEEKGKIKEEVYKMYTQISPLFKLDESQESQEENESIIGDSLYVGGRNLGNISKIENSLVTVNVYQKDKYVDIVYRIEETEGYSRFLQNALL